MNSRHRGQGSIRRRWGTISVRSSLDQDADEYVMRFAKDYPPLKLAEERRLIKMLKGHDASARAEAVRLLVLHNQRLCYQFAFANLGKGVELPDLVQVANIGLLKGIYKYDPNKGTRLVTCVWNWIRDSVQRAIQNTSKTIRVPASVQEDRAEIQKERNKAMLEDGVDLTADQIALRTGMDAEYIRSHWVHLKDTRSLDQIIPYYDGFITLGDIAAISTASEPDEKIASIENREKLDNLLSQLPPQDAEFISRRFGLKDNVERTKSQLCEIYGISEPQCYTREKKILKRLKELAVREHFNDFS